MAAVIISRGAPLAKLLEKLMATPSRGALASQSAARSFNAHAQMREAEEGNERGLGGRVASRRLHDADYPFFPGVFDLINATRSLGQVLSMMDQLAAADGGAFPLSARGMGGGARHGWDAKEDEDALRLRIDMPGLGKEHVKVGAEQNTLIIRGDGEKESEEEEAGNETFRSNNFLTFQVD